ncbi:glycoside hydrolase family 2 TIM barrel-domain containing protein [Kutzneria sp. 744]|uniref:glycoside hydrolase family 2 protein n=1 Tax=Kutzneria sp. (strain 744) TaxID=345341 RepID=UPI0003EEE18F|nr:glycoside hydrolase family 2 TIM barrel-domain containing protein [Kutzneria sp. 744]EWM19232.1 beta-mannosidase [Kutzneria sp. 744]
MRRALGRGLVAALLVSLVAATGAMPGQAEPAGGERGLQTLGGQGWQVQSSAQATQPGAEVSKPGFDTRTWLKVRPDDGGAPGTEITALLQNGKCPDVYFSDNMRKCFGYTTDNAGPVTIPPFDVPWWFRTDFTPDGSGDTRQLIVNGVIGKADVWVNGQQVAISSTVTGAYTKFTFDVSKLTTKGRNTVALKLYPNDPGAMFTVSDIDWNQVPPDNNTGIHFPVQLKVSGALNNGNARVLQDNTKDMSRSTLTAKTDVTNNGDRTVTTVAKATVTDPNGRRDTVQQTVTVQPHSTQTVTFRPIVIDHPKVWWPYYLGDQPLYTLTTEVQGSGTSEQFGIRTVTTGLISPSPAAPQGVRQYSINGKPLVIRGAGFAEDLFLRYDSADIAKQIRLLKNMGINLVRVEGHFLPDDFYQQMDRAGIMVNAGWSCCDHWELPGNEKGVTDEDFKIIQNSAQSVGERLRDHPSVITFNWSDNQPTPRQEAVSLQGFKDADFTQPVVASAEYKASPKLGQAGEKEGPYDYVSPSYWYDTTHFDPTDDSRTNVGGSWGFDSEQSAGDTVPTRDSLNRFMSADEQAKLWQDPAYNQYHLNFEADHGGYAFGTLFTFDTALQNRYGQWNSLDQYVQQAQVQNYENTRSQFEAFIDHSTNQPTPATGTIYWQGNKGWPSLLWTLYNNDGDQAGSFFGAKKANEPLHVLYGYDDGGVTIDNLGADKQDGLTVESKVYDTDGNVLDSQRTAPTSLASQQVSTDVLKPKTPAVTTPPAKAQTYFVELLLRKGNQVVDRNVYWLSTQQDVVDWPASYGNPQATMTQYGNLKGLQNLQQAKVSAVAASQRQRDGKQATKVTVTNTSKQPIVGFFLRADIRRGNADGSEKPGDNQVTSGVWSDNDVTLWPGESQTLTVTYDAADLRGATPVVSLQGWNLPKFDVKAGSDLVSCAAQEAAVAAHNILHVG